MIHAQWLFSLGIFTAWRLGLAVHVRILMKETVNV